MKKLFNVFLFLCVATFAFAMTTTKVHAEGEATGAEPATETSTLTVHFAKADKKYDQSGLHTWGLGQSDTHTGWPIMWEETDDFGGKITMTIDSKADAKIGLIPLKTLMKAGDWTGAVKTFGENNLYFPTELLSAKGGQYDHLDIYMIEGAGNYVIAYPDKVNIMVGYYDPSGAYEENLGVHIWDTKDYINAQYVQGYDDTANGLVGGTVETIDTSVCSWGTPIEVFTDGMGSQSGNPGKLAMLYATPDKAVGGLIYAGDDATKKYSSDVWTGVSLKAGEIHQAFVTGGKLFTDVATFLETAFSFKFQGFGTDEKGNFIGTYAPNPTSIIVSFDSAVSYPTVAEGEDLAAKIASRFTLNEATIEGETITKGAEVAIKQVDFNKSVTSASEFVVQLADNVKLDNTKHYVLTYSEREEAATEEEKANKNYGEIDVDLDREAPTIVVGTTEKIPYGKLFDFGFIPEITVTDNRDSEVSYYCIQGQESTLDTGKPGEQKVKIFATDNWGNTAEAYITFTVGAAPKEGCNKGAIIVALSTLAAASTAFIVLRKRNA